MLQARRSRRRLAVAVSGALWCLGCGVADPQAISPAHTPGGTGAAVAVVSGASADYRPTLGDLMTLAIQPRHIRLGLAGEERNWAYAAYELDELRGAFGRTGRAVPVYDGTDSAALMAQYVKGPLDALERAIRERSGVQFRRQYRALTTACNACHASQNHAQIVIRVPDADVFPDQSFAPRR